MTKEREKVPTARLCGSSLDSLSCKLYQIVKMKNLYSTFTCKHILYSTSPVLVTIFESCAREQGDETTVTPIGLVLALYERCARGRLRRDHLPLRQIEQELEVRTTNVY